jgi:hypothetical protein
MKAITKYSFRHVYKQAVIYGLALGIIMEIMNIPDYFVYFHEQYYIISNIKYLLRIFGLLICVIIFRKNNGRYISFEKAFVFSLFTFVFAMFICDTIVCILFNLYPELLQNKILMMREILINAGASDRIIELSANYALWAKNPYYVIFSFIIWALFVGPVISFIIALMTKK